MNKTVSVLLGLLFASHLFAQQPTPPEANPKAESKADERFPAPPAEEKSSKTQHTIHVNGQELRYTAVAGTLLLRKDDGKPKASIFYIAYTLDGADATKRPLTFSFNGGPGSSSVWLHMGALGPRRVPLTPEGTPVPPPYHVIDNQQTALAFTDLVFIDPVTTGFSRNAPGVDPKEFHGLEEDLDSVSDFIRLYLTRYERWDSPKFLAGESYGTTRAAGLSKYLLERHGIYLNGITLISSALNFQTLDFRKGNDLPYVMFLPSYTATAWFHKKLPADLQSGDVQHAVEEARKFAGTTYALALMKGDKLSESERKQIVQQLARLTGLSEKYIDESNLRIQDQRFMKELLRGDRVTVGRYDSRLEGVDLDAISEAPEYDPSYAAVQGAYTAAFNEYVRKELNWQTDVPYEILTPKVRPWNYSEFINAYVDVSDRLGTAMSQNQFMHVLQMNGYYDLATPFFATEYTFDHLGIPPKLHKNISMAYCGAGHMLYLKQSCLETLHKSMGEMYQSALTSH
jgi:carboxypeptidase C (cathepsin A)